MSDRLAKIPQLDALRAVAAIAIIAYHYMPEFGFGRLPYGWIGVDLFFVISGYLITAILLRQKASPIERPLVLRNFIIKRSLRLFPAYFAFIAVFAVLMVTTGLWSWDRGQGIWYWTYTSNILQFVHGPKAGHLTHLWSLAVEEQFYLFWPWLVIFIRGSWLNRTVLGLVIFSFIFKSFSGIEGVRMLTISHFDTLGCGALIAMHRPSMPRLLGFMERYQWPILALGGTMLLFHEEVRHVEVLKNFAVLSISTTLVIGCLAGFRGGVGWLMDKQWLSHLGRISYGLYLFHKPIPLLLKLVLARAHLTLPDPLLLIICITLAWCIAELSFRFLETPFLRLKQRFDL